MHSVIIACTITTLITTYIYIASFKVQLSQKLQCSVSYRWGYLNKVICLVRARYWRLSLGLSVPVCAILQIAKNVRLP